MDISFLHVKHLYTANAKILGVVRLSRWREHVPYTIPAVVGGAMIAVYQTGGALDFRLLAVAIASILAMSFAFIINDVEDAPDDALDPQKKLHNVISSGILSPREGALLAWLTFVASLLFYGLAGGWPLFWGGMILALSYLYSAHPFRFKARPVTDVVSHALMLSGLLVMVGYFTYSDAFGVGWYMIAAATLFSAYGQFYNQVDDYDVDKAAGLKNTVVLLGKRGTMTLMYLCAIGAVIFMCMAILGGAFPLWLGPVAIITIFTMALFRWEIDMRGKKAEGSGLIQIPGLVLANIVILLWLAQHIGLLNIG